MSERSVAFKAENGYGSKTATQNCRKVAVGLQTLQRYNGILTTSVIKVFDDRLRGTDIEYEFFF